ncbi:MAG: NFACT family protein [Sphaerochaetaceae bacterium]|nr:NFACT family protein [Sphaerochaetaceae bacterium]
MSLNWREIALIISELPLEGSLIQRTHQLGFHALVFEMYHNEVGFWELYMEFGTPTARMHRLSGPPRESRKYKTKKLQRFIQYLRAHVEGSRVVTVSQLANDRLVVLKLTTKGIITFMILRFYSGPGANVIICDEHMIIQELLYRRPKRNETVGNPLMLPEAPLSNADDGTFLVRDYPREMSFNQFIEQTYQQVPTQEIDYLITQVERKRDEELALLQNQIRQTTERVEHFKEYESYRISGDLLAASIGLIEPHQTWVEVPDYRQVGSQATIAIDPSLSPGENIASYYKKYQKGKATWERAQAELVALKKRLEQKEQHYAKLLTPLPTTGKPDMAALKAYLHSHQTTLKSRSDPYAEAPGLRFSSGAFTILVGRNAKENEALLRRWSRGNDWWMHTRDSPGGYVIIKTIAGKTIPLETLLDAGNLALLYSKAKESGKADLYYTQVKYLKRPKGGKKGLVIPTQERNIRIQLDEERIKRLFSTEDLLPGQEPIDG